MTHLSEGRLHGSTPQPPSRLFEAMRGTGLADQAEERHRAVEGAWERLRRVESASAALGRPVAWGRSTVAGRSPQSATRDPSRPSNDPQYLLEKLLEEQEYSSKLRRQLQKAHEELEAIQRTSRTAAEAAPIDAGDENSQSVCVTPRSSAPGPPIVQSDNVAHEVQQCNTNQHGEALVPCESLPCEQVEETPADAASGLHRTGDESPAGQSGGLMAVSYLQASAAAQTGVLQYITWTQEESAAWQRAALPELLTLRSALLQSLLGIEDEVTKRRLKLRTEAVMDDIRAEGIAAISSCFRRLAAELFHYNSLGDVENVYFIASRLVNDPNCVEEAILAIAAVTDSGTIFATPQKFAEFANRLLRRGVSATFPPYLSAGEWIEQFLASMGELVLAVQLYSDRTWALHRTSLEDVQRNEHMLSILIRIAQGRPFGPTCIGELPASLIDEIQMSQELRQQKHLFQPHVQPNVADPAQGSLNVSHFRRTEAGRVVASPRLMGVAAQQGSSVRSPSPYRYDQSSVAASPCAGDGPGSLREADATISRRRRLHSTSPRCRHASPMMQLVPPTARLLGFDRSSQPRSFQRHSSPGMDSRVSRGTVPDSVDGVVGLSTCARGPSPHAHHHSSPSNLGTVGAPPVPVSRASSDVTSPGFSGVLLQSHAAQKLRAPSARSSGVGGVATGAVPLVDLSKAAHPTQGASGGRCASLASARAVSDGANDEPTPRCYVPTPEKRSAARSMVVEVGATSQARMPLFSVKRPPSPNPLAISPVDGSSNRSAGVPGSVPIAVLSLSSARSQRATDGKRQLRSSSASRRDDDGHDSKNTLRRTSSAQRSSAVPLMQPSWNSSSKIGTGSVPPAGPSVLREHHAGQRSTPLARLGITPRSKVIPLRRSASGGRGAPWPTTAVAGNAANLGAPHAAPAYLTAPSSHQQAKAPPISFAALAFQNGGGAASAMKSARPVNEGAATPRLSGIFNSTVSSVTADTPNGMNSTWRLSGLENSAMIGTCVLVSQSRAEDRQ